VEGTCTAVRSLSAGQKIKSTRISKTRLHEKMAMARRGVGERGSPIVVGIPLAFFSRVTLLRQDPKKSIGNVTESLWLLEFKLQTPLLRLSFDDLPLHTSTSKLRLDWPPG
jgi:hypothetical protein